MLPEADETAMMKAKRKKPSPSKPRYFERIDAVGDGTDLVAVLECGDAVFLDNDGRSEMISDYGLDDMLSLVLTGHWREVTA